MIHGRANSLVGKPLVCLGRQQEASLPFRRLTVKRAGVDGGGRGRGGVSRTPTKEWLDQVIEEPIETDIPIVDSHHHMAYTPGPSRYNLEEFWPT